MTEILHVADGKSSQCGLMIIDLNVGEVLHWLHIDGVVEELFNAKIRQLKALSFQDNDIEYVINFPYSST